MATDTPFPIAVLVSGTGTNLQALIDSVHGREVEIVAVARNAADAPALRRARDAGIPPQTFPRRDYADRAERDHALAEWVQSSGAPGVVLAGYMELLGDDFLGRFPLAVINVHPSLCPPSPACTRSSRRSPTGSRCSG